MSSQIVAVLTHTHDKSKVLTHSKVRLWFGDVLIAWDQNGVRLHPDHGFPVLVVIPGWIGRRMVKWLEEIEVMDKPSENHYHFFDNRILPPHVDAELAKAENWWYKTEYLFNEFNINSAIGSREKIS